MIGSNTNKQVELDIMLYTHPEIHNKLADTSAEYFDKSIHCCFMKSVDKIWCILRV